MDELNPKPKTRIARIPRTTTLTSTRRKQARAKKKLMPSDEGNDEASGAMDEAGVSFTTAGNHARDNHSWRKHNSSPGHGQGPGSSLTLVCR
jgi:hypothetical protein